MHEKKNPDICGLDNLSSTVILSVDRLKIIN